MSRHLINFSMIFIPMCLSNTFFEKGNTTEQQTQLVRQTQINPQASLQNTAGNAGNSAVNSADEGIQPDSVVAISAGMNGSNPQVFYTGKGAVPSNWRGWFYIMSGAEYVNYINGNMVTQSSVTTQPDNTQQISNVATAESQHSPVRFNASMLSNYPKEIPANSQQQQLASNSIGLATNQLQPVTQQPITGQQINVRQPLEVIKPTPQHNLTAKEIIGGEKVEQGKPDNETPEVLIHDGAVYTLANSVEVTNTTNSREVQSPIQQSTQQVILPQNNQAQAVQSHTIQNQSEQPNNTQIQTNTPIGKQQLNQFVEALPPIQSQNVNERVMTQQATEVINNGTNILNNTTTAENNNQLQQGQNLSNFPTNPNQQNSK